MRAALAQKLGEPIEPPADAAGAFLLDPRVGSTMLRTRRSPSTTSALLALENDHLRAAQQAYLDALGPAAEGSDVIGAVFAIDGVIKGAEIYGWHQLFAAMWPNLLRAYATEAIAADASSQAPPAADAVTAFISGEKDGPAIVSGTPAPDHQWAVRSFVPKPDLAAEPATPEATLVKMLAQGRVNERPIAAMERDEQVILSPDADGKAWSASIEHAFGGLPSVFVPPLPTDADWRALRDDSGLSSRWLVLLIALASFALRVCLGGRGQRARRALTVNAPGVQAIMVRPPTALRKRRIGFAVIAPVAEALRVRTGRQLAALAKAALACAALPLFVLLWLARHGLLALRVLGVRARSALHALLRIAGEASRSGRRTAVARRTA